MRILTVENTVFDMTDLPNEVSDLRFCVLDNSNPAEADYYFLPLVFLESFNDPALVLKIGKHTIKMPYNWRILIGDQDIGDLEALPLTKINDRGFDVFTFNPISDFRPSFDLLCVPLEDGNKPRCAYFVKDISKASEQIDISRII